MGYDTKLNKKIILFIGIIVGGTFGFYGLALVYVYHTPAYDEIEVPNSQINAINNELSEITKNEKTIVIKGTVVFRSYFNDSFPYGLEVWYDINTETGTVTYCLTGDMLNQELVGKKVEIHAKVVENYSELIDNSQFGMSVPLKIPCDEYLLLVEDLNLQ